MGARRLALISGAALAGFLTAAVPATGAPLVRQATGANAAAITPAVDAFEEEVGVDNCPAMSGCRRIVWDGVPDERSDPAFMPEGQFRVAAGALFTTPGTGVQVSGDLSTPFTDPDLPDFAETNATYENEFEPFTPPRLFTSIGSNVIDTRFVVPGTDTPADTNAFGVVFSDVDVAGPTTMQYFATNGSNLGTFTVPATPGQQTFSFLGVIFDAGERIARVRITQGAAALATGVNDGAPADLVVTDNFVLGEPQAQAAVAPPAQDLVAPTLAVTRVPGKQKRAQFLKGVNFSVAPNEESQIDVTLVAKAKKATLSANGDLVLASRSFGFSTATRTGKLKPKKSLIGKAKKFTAKLQVVAIDRSGNKATVTRKIKVTTK
jgi:hypothetical protein